MIGAAIGQIAERLNLYLRRSYDLTEDIVQVSNVMEQDGSLAPNINNKLLAFLVNIEKGSPGGWQAGAGDGAGGARVVTRPPVHLHLYVMIAAHFAGGNYREALKFISGAIMFFQGNPILDHANTPDLDSRIERLVLDIENLSTHELSNLWGVLSGRYLPSVLYKVRMVTVDAGDVVGVTQPLLRPEPTVAS